MKDLIMLLASKVLKPEFMSTDLEKVSTFAQKQACYLPIDACNYGVSYYAGLLDLKVTNEKKNVVEDRAFKYIKTLLLELIKRLPQNLKHFKRLQAILTEICLSQTRRYKFQDLPFLYKYAGNEKLSLIKNQYIKLVTVD